MGIQSLSKELWKSNPRLLDLGPNVLTAMISQSNISMGKLCYCVDHEAYILTRCSVHMADYSFISTHYISVHQPEQNPNQ